MHTLDPASVASLRHAIEDCIDNANCRAADLLQHVPLEIRTASWDVILPGPSDNEKLLARREEDQLRIARGFFSSKEYARTAFILETCTSPKARFLALYSRFLMTEKKSYEEFERAVKKQQYGGRTNSKYYPRRPVNTSLSLILSAIEETNDPFLLFLKGLLLQRLNHRDKALEVLILSVTAYPWNWSAWQAIVRCIKDKAELARLRPLLPVHPTQAMLNLYYASQIHAMEDEELDECDRLLTIFPGCPMIIGWKAHCLYMMKELEASEKLFDELLVKDPFRIEDIDIYSAILFVLGKKAKLSKLARRFSGMSRDRPEVCWDHYSLRGENEKAIKYYRRAVLLDQNCIAAWTLLGHAFVEMKNAHAAIESYRRAIDMAPQDPRAWFGLGQAYALLCMFQYALYYYQRAVALRPRDARIWQELSACYVKVDRPLDGVDCLKRAIAVASRDDTVIKLKLATLYETLKDSASASIYHTQYMETCERLGKGVSEYSRSCIYVAKHHVQIGKLADVELAISLLEKIANSNAEENQLAKDALPKLENVRQSLLESE
ncbi:related to CDC23-Subunit of anaphase-promoting complex (cyclosome) [Serendipita indica DSM 11827]|uniref:Related to CDC23-Subunit of anaphase-promoting complex (Cyclosome) n=1 Tax=Serendipita indica (strain DSM 11827) TaxID=1109443 RepID=G4TTU0_SERID|nr:related to CDC23-Subunit of anaphase-promoting complex (cyclosome) [Serendipita indica DSM 11827]